MAHNTEKTAINFVMKYEKSEGRNPKIVSGTRGKHWDIESGKRLIEVKGLCAGRQFDFWLTDSLFEFDKLTRSKYYIYIVHDIGIRKQPKLKILYPDKIFKNLCEVTRAWIEPKNVLKFGKDIAT